MGSRSDENHPRRRRRFSESAAPMNFSGRPASFIGRLIYGEPGPARNLLRRI
jgi:hypothetical protein